MGRRLKSSVRYKVRGDKKGSGWLTKTKTSVYVDESTCHKVPSQNCVNFSLDCCHPNYLQCRLIDFKNNIIVHVMHDRTLLEHAIFLRDLNALPIVMQYSHPCKNSTKPYKHSYIPERYIILIKSMLQFVYDMHQKNRALSRFSVDNIVIKDDRLCFRNIWFKTEATVKRKKKDYKCVCRVLDALFKYLELYMPPVLQDLFDRMKKYDGISQEEYFLNHIALLTHAQRVSFMKNCDEVGKSLVGLEGSAYKAIVSGQQMKVEWNSIIEDDEDGYGPLYDILMSGRYDDSNQKLLRFWRNATTHLIDYSYVVPYIQEFRVLDADLVIMAAFEAELIYLQGQFLAAGIYMKFL